MLDLSGVPLGHRIKFKDFKKKIHINSKILYFPQDAELARRYFEEETDDYDILEHMMMKKYQFHVVEVQALDHPANITDFELLRRREPEKIPSYMLWFNQNCKIFIYV